MADNWQLKAVLSAVDKMSPVLKSVAGVAKTTRKYLTDVASSAGALAGKIGLPLTVLSGVLGGFSLAAIKKAIVGFTDMGEAVYKGSLRAGMSVQEYQRMKYVAEQAGVGVEQLEGSMAKLNSQTAKAAAGKNKDLSALYQRLGISVRDGNGKIRSAVDLLPQLADAFKRNENPAVRARMGVALFGRAWAEMAPFLMEGSEGLQKSLKRFEQLKGMGMDEATILSAKELGDKFKDLDFVTKGFQNTIAKELVPVISPLIEDIIQWAAANRKVVASGVKDFVRDLLAGLKSIDWQHVIQGAKDFANSIGWVVDKVGGFQNALIGLVIFMNIQTIAAFAGLIGSVWRLIWGLGALVVTSIPAAIGGLSALGASMVTAGTAANALLGLLGKIGAVAAAGAIGYQIGGLINDYVINPAVQKLSGDKDASLGTWLYDKMNGDPMASNRPSLVGAQSQVKASGKIEVSFKDAPHGMRVEQTGTNSDVPINTNVGYRSYALGMP